MAEYDRTTQDHIFVNDNACACLGKVVPFLEIDGVVIPVKLAEPTHQEVLIGPQRRTFSGLMRSGVRARIREFHVVTPLLPRAEANDLLRLLQQTPPLPTRSLMFSTDEIVPAFIAPINGGYHRGGAIDASAGRQYQLMSLEFLLMLEGEEPSNGGAGCGIRTIT